MDIVCVGFIVMSCHINAPAQRALSFCDGYRPIYWSAGDTRKTKEQVDRLNRKWREFCTHQ